jgi:hypothetical protein
MKLVTKQFLAYAFWFNAGLNDCYEVLAVYPSCNPFGDEGYGWTIRREYL